MLWAIIILDEVEGVNRYFLKQKVSEWQEKTRRRCRRGPPTYSVVSRKSVPLTFFLDVGTVSRHVSLCGGGTCLSVLVVFSMVVTGRQEVLPDISSLVVWTFCVAAVWSLVYLFLSVLLVTLGKSNVVIGVDYSPTTGMNDRLILLLYS